jgi:hypothetical protein
MYHYFPFTPISNYTGSYSNYSSTSFQVPIGNICQPADILKFNAGTNAWSQIPNTQFFLNNELQITSLLQNDWINNLQEKWFDDYLRYVNLYDYITPSEKNILYNHVLSLDLFQLLSSPSVAYVTRNDGTNGLIIDPYLTNEVSICLNVYHTPIILDYVKNLPNNNPLKNKVFLHHKKGNILVSNVCKVDYQSQSEYVWCFDGYEYKNYDLTNIGLVPSLANGGGNFFGEVKMAGNHVQAHYIVKKNIDENDPTVGLCSGDNPPFCFGDEIVIIDTTCWTSNGTNGWDWLGNYSQLEYLWHIADVTEPKVYATVPISSQLFPLRIIQFLKFNDFD